MKVLLTGFEPFGGEPVNPAWEAVKLSGAPEGVELIKKEIPTVFGEAIDVLYETLRAERPDAVILVGQAAGRKGITPERVAINVDDARIADNKGNIPVDAPIISGGENAYFSKLPIKEIVKAIREAGIESSVSDTAGTFVCNHLFYGLRAFMEKEGYPEKGGFIHVPCIEEQLSRMPAGTPAMALKDIVRGLEIAVEITISEN